MSCEHLYAWKLISVRVCDIVSNLLPTLASIARHGKLSMSLAVRASLEWLLLVFVYVICAANQTARDHTCTWT